MSVPSLSREQGPYHQRIYRAGANGTNLTQISNLDSGCIRGMVDITASPENKICFLTFQKNVVLIGIIYRISSKNKISEFLGIGAGRDPKNIDIDWASKMLFYNAVGIFRIVHCQVMPS